MEEEEGRTRLAHEHACPPPPRDSLATSARTRPDGGGGVDVFRRVIFFSFPFPSFPSRSAPYPAPASLARGKSVALPPPARPPVHGAIGPHTCDSFSPVSALGRRILGPFFPARRKFDAPASVRPASGVRDRSRRPPDAGLSVILWTPARRARAFSAAAASVQAYTHTHTGARAAVQYAAARGVFLSLSLPLPPSPAQRSPLPGGVSRRDVRRPGPKRARPFFRTTYYNITVALSYNAVVRPESIMTRR